MFDPVWIVLAFILAVVITLGATFYRRGLRALERMRVAHDEELSRLGVEHDARISRLGRETEDLVRHAHHDLIRDILPAVDALHEAIAQARQADDPQWCKGLELTLSQLTAALLKHGVEAIDPAEGEPFDPNLHEAVQAEARDDQPPDQIVRLLRRGYRHGERIIRPAMVVVSRPEQSGSDESRPDEDIGSGP